MTTTATFGRIAGHARKTLAVLLGAATIGLTMVPVTTTSAEAQWRGHHGYGPGYYRGHRGGWGRGPGVAAGIVGGLAAGALIAGAARPYYYGGYGPAYYSYGGGYDDYVPRCRIVRERFERWDGAIGVRRIRVCD